MKPPCTPAWLLPLLFLATPAVAQFVETATAPPPSAKELDLPTVVETLSKLPMVDEATPDGVNGFIRDLDSAILLGKALFWDQQVGSADVACGTCHYHAGADARERNQLSPGLNGGNQAFDRTTTGRGGANYKLREGDFPFHRLVDPGDRTSMVLHDTDDVTSSQGTFAAVFNDIVLGEALDDCTVVPDPDGFQVRAKNTRRVEPRNAPTVINAAFNHRNFWDGRANNIFNGVDVFGQRNAAARILEVDNGNVVKTQVAFENSSLASQAVGPPVSNKEMSCDGRTFPKIGKKLLSLDVLQQQLVHQTDSVLGQMSAWPSPGLSNNGAPNGEPATYGKLIEDAFATRFWDSDKLFDAEQNEIGFGEPATTNEYTLMEVNFALFFGLAVQAYERTLVSDDAPYDQWAEAPGGRSPDVDNAKGILTDAQMRGMNLFFTNELAPEDKVGLRGNCSTCHQGPLFSTATFPFTEEAESGEFPEREQLVERMRRGDAFNIAEDLFRYFISGQGTVGGFNIAGMAGARELPSRYPAAVGGDITVNGRQCQVRAFLMNQDLVAGAPPPYARGPVGPVLREPPPVPPGPSDFADYSTRDAVFRVNCRRRRDLEITIIDNGVGTDTATIRWVADPGAPAPCPNCYPIPPVYGPTLASGAVDGDFTLGIPTLYDTAFYNIGVRPTAEDPGVGADDPWGNPLSITQQWIDQLLGTPAPDAAAIKSLNFSRVTEPFSWYGDSVFFPGGFAGYVWLTHRLEANPAYPAPGECLRGPGAPPLPGGPFPDREACEDAGGFWSIESEFSLAPQFFPPRPGRGDDAVPAYDPDASPFPNVANLEPILAMPTGIDGAFKVPNLRNVTLTAPFFHNGGQLTLRQVMEFYNRGGDFAVENLGDLAPNIHALALDDQQIDDVVAFLEALTDARVTCERAPFDHPQIVIQPGHRFNERVVLGDGNGNARDRSEIIQATGAGGRAAVGLPCLGSENFLE